MISQISVGKSHGLMLMDNNDLYVWGMNLNGQAGISY
jgi:alpha-tubulin suppressor-like RCC1 family protein